MTPETPPVVKSSLGPGPGPESPTFADGDVYAAIDALASGDDGKPESPAPVVPEKPSSPALPRGEDGRFKKPEEKAPEKAPEKPPVTPDSKKEPEKAEKPKATEKVPETNPELRAAYDQSKKKFSDLQKEYEDFKAKATKPADDTERKQLSDRLTEREKRIAQLEEEIRDSAYERSTEYKEKFYKPFEDAYVYGQGKTAALKVVQKSDSEGRVIREARQATPEDFQTMMRFNDDDAAAEWAYDMFGNKAPVVIFQRERVNELNANRTRALEEGKKGYSEKLKKQQDDEKTFRESFETSLSKEMTAAVDKYPQWFKPSDSDEKEVKAADAGKHLIERVLAGGRPLKDGEKQMSMQELARAHAAMRTKASFFDLLVHRYDSAMKQVKGLTKELEQYRESTPKGGTAKAPKATAQPPGEPDDLGGALAQLEREYSK